jgi:hypothetical protein
MDEKDPESIVKAFVAPVIMTPQAALSLTTPKGTLHVQNLKACSSLRDLDSHRSVNKPIVEVYFGTFSNEDSCCQLGPL